MDQKETPERMIIQLVFLLALLTTIFLLAKRISNSLYSLIYLLTRRQKMSLWLLAVFFLPGTIIHELSHFILALILRVPAGRLTIFPTVSSPSKDNKEKEGREVSLRGLKARGFFLGATVGYPTWCPKTPYRPDLVGTGSGVIAGKIHIAKTDPFRHTIIGLAPMIIGLVLVYFIANLFILENFRIPDTKYQILNTLLGVYLLFITSATMFSSRKDLEALIISGPIIMLLFLGLYATGIRIFITQVTITKIEQILKNLNYALATTAVINLLLWGINMLFYNLLQTILSRSRSSRR